MLVSLFTATALAHGPMGGKGHELDELKEEMKMLEEMAHELGGKGGKGPSHEHKEEKEEKHEHKEAPPHESDFAMQDEMSAVLAELMGSTSTTDGGRAARYRYGRSAYGPYRAGRSLPNFIKYGRTKNARAAMAGESERDAAAAMASTAFPEGLTDQEAGTIADRAEKMLEIGAHWDTASKQGSAGRLRGFIIGILDAEILTAELAGHESDPDQKAAYDSAMEIVKALEPYTTDFNFMAVIMPMLKGLMGTAAKWAEAASSTGASGNESSAMGMAQTLSSHLDNGIADLYPRLATAIGEDNGDVYGLMDAISEHWMKMGNAEADLVEANGAEEFWV